MKRYHLFALPLLIPFLCICACSSPDVAEKKDPVPMFRLHRLYYENSTGEIGITSYYYDREGKNYLAHWKLEDSSRSSVNTHEFDTLGNMIRKHRIFSNGTKSEQTFEYDSAGRLVRQDFRRSDGTTGMSVYLYDENGMLSKAECKGLNGWFYGQIHYLYENGIRAGAILTKNSDTTGYIEYGYDEDRLVFEFWDFNGEWSQTYRYEYVRAAARTFTYSNVFIRESPWFRVAEESYSHNGQEVGPSYYYYGEKGWLESKEFHRSGGLHTVTRYEYDSTGLLRYSHRGYAEGDTALFHYWYGINRELLVRTWEHPAGKDGSETYRYDDNGFLNEGLYENVDGWLSGNLQFEPDEKGLITGAYFEGTGGNKAVLTFDYDLNFNLLKIDWEFTDGTTQTYRFRYEPAGL